MQVRFAVGIDAKPGVLLNWVGSGFAAVLHAVNDDVEIGIGRRLAAHVQVMRVTALGVIHEAVGGVVAIVDGPVIPHRGRDAALRAFRDAR